MSGGIKYRLTSRERAWFADQLGVLDALRARLKPVGIDAKLGDPEMEVSVEEAAKGPLITIEYPFDTDGSPFNGRLYVKDVFQLSSGALQLLSLDRTVRPDNQTKTFRYWVEAARKDHPQLKTNDPVEHLERFVDDLNSVPTPEVEGPETRRFFENVLQRLHRPFPDNNATVVKKNFDVFRPVADKLAAFGIRMKFGDPQSGLSLRREGEKWILSVQVVLDNDASPGLAAEKNGRMFLLDSYEIDAATLKAVAAKREIVPSEFSGTTFDKAFDRIKDSPPPDPQMKELQALARAWLEGIGGTNTPGTAAGAAAAPIPAQPPADPAGKKLYALYLDTAERPDPKLSLLSLGEPKREPGETLPPLVELDRSALHDILGWVLAGDPAKTAEAVERWSQEEALTADTRSLLQSLKKFAAKDFAGARRELAGVSGNDRVVRRLENALYAAEVPVPRPANLDLLKIGALERCEQENNGDAAWLPSFKRELTGGAHADPVQRRFAVESFFKRLEASLEASPGKLAAALATTTASGEAEQEVKAWLRNDPALVELVDLLDESDAGIRDGSLIRFADTRLAGPAKLPITAKAIAERVDGDVPGARALRDWFSGKATFGQKFERVVPALAEEALAPRTLLSMMAAGTLAQLGKAAFFGRVGYQTRRLRLAAEAVSVGVEAPAFVITDKLLASTFVGPAQQWDHLPRDVAGAFLAFGALRGAGLGSRRLNRALENSKSLEGWAEARSRFDFAERWLPGAKDLAKAEGRFGALGRAASKVAVPSLQYLGETGISRRWVPGLLRGLSSHGLSLVALSSANGLNRAIGLREPSGQGWSGDAVDDFLMYGHFLVAGHIAQRLGRGDLDARLGMAEAMALEAKAETGAKLLPERTSSPDSEKLPALDVPPELKNFGRNLRSWLGRYVPPFGRRAWEWFGSRVLRWKTPPAAPHAAVDAAPISTRPPDSVPPVDSVPSGPKLLPASQPPKTAESIPPLAPEDTRPTVPGFPPAVLKPMEIKVPFRMLGEETVTPRGKPYNLPVEVLGREEELRVSAGEKLVERRFESILGREEIQSPAGATGTDFGFSSKALEIALRHARLLATVRWDLHREGKTVSLIPVEWTFSVENLGGTSGTFLNGKPVTALSPLQDGDLIRLGNGGHELVFHIDPAVPEAFLLRPGIPLAGAKGEWVLGREHAGANPPDIAFPLSDRDISRRHAQILRDGDGRYFLQDLGSTSGTCVNGRRVHGTVQLQDGDRLQLGRFDEMTFELPEGLPQPEGIRDSQFPPHPRLGAAPPEQAAVHPAYRNLTEKELDEFILAQARSPDSSEADFRAAQIITPDGSKILLNSLHTGWAVGAQGEVPGNSQVLHLAAPETAANNPVLLYLEPSFGEFILRPLRPEAEVYVQTRPERYWPSKGSPRNPTGKRQRLQGWTRLEGGERIFLGPDFFFDFWPGAPKIPQTLPGPVSGSIPAHEEFPVEVNPVPVKPVFQLGTGGPEMEVHLTKPVVFRSDPGQGNLHLTGQGSQPLAEVLVPEAEVKIRETRLFQAEDGSWKIRSEGGDGEPLSVNGMRLPAQIDLDLQPDSVIEAGDFKFKIRIP